VDEPAPATIVPESADLLIELESQQEEILQNLDELNRRIERAIAASQIRIRGAEAA